MVKPKVSSSYQSSIPDGVDTESYNRIFSVRQKITTNERGGDSQEKVDAAIKEWTRAGYVRVRAGQDPELEGILEDHVQGHDFDEKMYRGIQTNEQINFEKGSVVDQLGKLSSWSKNRYTASAFADDGDYPYHYLLVMHKGSSNSRDISKLSAAPSEGEVLMSGICRQRVINVFQIRPGYKQVWLEDYRDDN